MIAIDGTADVTVDYDLCAYCPLEHTVAAPARKVLRKLLMILSLYRTCLLSSTFQK